MYDLTVVTPRVRTQPLWISDDDVRLIFGRFRIYYEAVRNNVKYTADGVFVRWQRAKDGTLGQVYRNPIDGQNWLWVPGKRDRKPFALAKVG